MKAKFVDRNINFGSGLIDWCLMLTLAGFQLYRGIVVDNISREKHWCR